LRDGVGQGTELLFAFPHRLLRKPAGRHVLIGRDELQRMAGFIPQQLAVRGDPPCAAVAIDDAVFDVVFRRAL
jgi:hypothetical protein